MHTKLNRNRIYKYFINLQKIIFENRSTFLTRKKNKRYCKILLHSESNTSSFFRLDYSYILLNKQTFVDNMCNIDSLEFFLIIIKCILVIT